MFGNASNSPMQPNGAATFCSRVQGTELGPVIPELQAMPAKKAEGVPAKKAEGAPAKKGKGAPAKKGKGAPAKKAEGAPAKKGKGAPAQKAKRKAKRQAKTARNCKCRACERCHRNTAGDWIYGVTCGRKCPLCALFKSVYGSVPKFTLNNKKFTGCATCTEIDNDGNVRKLCQTCWSSTCKKREGCGNKEEPLGAETIRLFCKNASKGGTGLGGGFTLLPMEKEKARDLFESLGPVRSLARVTPAGADNSVKP